MAKSPPSFDFYTADFIEAVRLMEPDEVGAYILLLCYQWKHGHIPETDSQRRRASQVLDEDQWTRIWNSIRGKFTMVELGSIVDSDPGQDNRHVFANPRMHDDRQKHVPAYQKRCEINRQNRTKSKKNKGSKRFVNDSLTKSEGGREKSNTFCIPSLEDLRTYILDKSSKDCAEANEIAEAFFDFYESKGWKVGKAPMKSWKAAVRGWLRRDRQASQPKQRKLLRLPITDGSDRYRKEHDDENAG